MKMGSSRGLGGINLGSIQGKGGAFRESAGEEQKIYVGVVDCAISGRSGVCTSLIVKI